MVSCVGRDWEESGGGGGGIETSEGMWMSHGESREVVEWERRVGKIGF